jgi:hypothetical protein
MTTETKLNYTTPLISEGELVDFLTWLSIQSERDEADTYYFDQWLEFVEFQNVEFEAAKAVKH